MPGDEKEDSLKSAKGFLHAFRRLSARPGIGVEEPLIEAALGLSKHEAVEVALGLLASESTRLQRSAFKVLSTHPTERALSRLWFIYKTRFPVGTQITNATHDLQRDASEALLACAAEDLPWVVETIESSNPVSEPVHILVYALAGSPVAREAWYRLKGRVTSLYRHSHRGCLIQNIRTHKDAQEIEWLISLLPENSAGVGTQALCALAAIDIQLAIECIPKVNASNFYMSRQWCFLELWSLDPQKTLSQMSQIIRGASDPWSWANVFQGCETIATREICEYLLSKLEELVALELASPSPFNEVPLWHPLQLLAEMNTAEQLEAFAMHRGKPLENHLNNWLQRMGPRQGVWVRHQVDFALHVLLKIGGHGFADVANLYLKADNQYGRRDGAEIAPKSPNDDTVSLLAQVSKMDHLWGPDNNPGYVGEPFPVEQHQALKALAHLQEWEHVLHGVLKWGSLVTDGLVEERRNGQLSCSEIELKLRERAFGDTENPIPNAIVAVGLIGASKYIPLILTTLSKFEGDAEVAVACALAIDYSDDKSSETEKALIRLLEVPRCQYVAARALLRFGTQSAKDALLQHLERKFDVFIFNGLLSLGQYHRKLGELLWKEIRLGRHEAEFECSLEPLAYLDSDEVKEHIERLALQNTGLFLGVRTSAIKAFAIYDRNRAISAGIDALRNSKPEDRQQVPRILMELDASKAAETLFEQAQCERDRVVYFCLINGLAACVKPEQVMLWINSASPSNRRVACHIASELPRADWLHCVQGRLLDVDRTVAAAARDTMRSWHRSETLQSLIQKFKATTVPSAKWRTRDCILAVIQSPEGNDTSQVVEECIRAISDTGYTKRYVEQKMRRHMKSGRRREFSGI